jgi:hypothetical protein
MVYTYTFTNGTVANATEVNQNFEDTLNAMASIWNDTAQNLFNATYLGFDSKLVDSGTPSLKNVFYSVFTSDDADTVHGFEYDSADDLYKTVNAFATGTTESTQSISSYTDNSTTVNFNFSASADLIVKDVRFDVSSSDTFTVNIIEDGDTIASKSVVADNINTVTFTGADYSRVISSGQSFTVQITSGTRFIYYKTGETFTGTYFSLTNGTLPGVNGVGSCYISIETADDTSTEGTLIFKDTTSETCTNAIPVINSSIDATSSQQISVSADAGSNWVDVNNAEYALLENSGTSLWRRIVVTRTNSTKIDKVTEQAVKYNLY